MIGWVRLSLLGRALGVKLNDHQRTLIINQQLIPLVKVLSSSGQRAAHYLVPYRYMEEFGEYLERLERERTATTDLPLNQLLTSFYNQPSTPPLAQALHEEFNRFIIDNTHRAPDGTAYMRIRSAMALTDFSMVGLLNHRQELIIQVPGEGRVVSVEVLRGTVLWQKPQPPKR